MEQHELPYTQVRNQDLRRADLRQRFDVVLLADMKSRDIITGYRARNVRPEYRGGIGAAGVRNLQAFLAAGGTVITLGRAADFAIQHLGVPFVNALQGVSEDDFFCPGAILRVALDTTHPIAYGMPREADVMFINNGGYLPTRTTRWTSAVTIGRYPQRTLLRSGWIGRGGAAAGHGGGAGSDHREWPRDHAHLPGAESRADLGHVQAAV